MSDQDSVLRAMRREHSEACRRSGLSPPSLDDWHELFNQYIAEMIDDFHRDERRGQRDAGGA